MGGREKRNEKENKGVRRESKKMGTKEENDKKGNQGKEKEGRDNIRIREIEVRIDRKERGKRRKNIITKNAKVEGKRSEEVVE